MNDPNPPLQNTPRPGRRRRGTAPRGARRRRGGRPDRRHRRAVPRDARRRRGGRPDRRRRGAVPRGAEKNNENAHVVRCMCVVRCALVGRALVHDCPCRVCYCRARSRAHDQYLSL